MKLKSILLSIILSLISTGCVIVDDEAYNGLHRTQSGHLVYLGCEDVILQNMNDVSLMLTLDRYLTTDDEDLREQISNSFMSDFKISKNSDNIYELSRNNISYYKVKTNNVSLSDPGSVWELISTNNQDYIYGVTTFICKNENEWDISIDDDSILIRSEGSRYSLNFNIKRSIETLNKEILLRELVINGNGSWENSMNVTFNTKSPVAYRETYISSSFSGNPYNRRYFLGGGKINMSAKSFNSEKKYPILAEIIENKETKDFDVVISFNGFTETWRNYGFERYW